MGFEEKERRLARKTEDILLGNFLAQIEAHWRDVPELEIRSRELAHLAIICDGNRRSAKEKGLPELLGHRLGVEVITGISRACRKWDVKHLTFWVFSTENWGRDKEQVEFLMDLFERFGSDPAYLAELQENKVGLTHFGRKDHLTTNLRQLVDYLEKETRRYQPSFNLNIALDYGGVDEINRALARILQDMNAGWILPREVLDNEDMIFDYLDSRGQPNPDLVVRTGGVGDLPHTSGFMPIQTAYSSWAFIDDYFPDLTPQTLMGNIHQFIKNKRRFGA